MKTRVPAAILAALSFCVAQAHAQSIYVSQAESECSVSFDVSLEGRFFVVLYAPEHQNATGAWFRIQLDGFGPEDEAILTAPAGMSVSGNIADGVLVTWSPHTFWVERILGLEVVDNAPKSNYFGDPVFARVVDAVLLAGGSPVVLDETQTYRIHCYGGGGLSFEPPTDATVVAGATTVVTFTGVSSGGYYGPGATNLTAQDTQGWVQPFNGSLWNTGCGECPWWWEDLDLIVVVPEDTPEGTQSLVTIREGSSTLISFLLTSTHATPVESTTWGAVKALYR